MSLEFYKYSIKKYTLQVKERIQTQDHVDVSNVFSLPLTTFSHFPHQTFSPEKQKEAEITHRTFKTNDSKKKR